MFIRRAIHSHAYLWALLAFLISLTLAQSSAAPNSNFVNALWVGESQGILKFATATGSVLLGIPSAKEVCAVATDEKRGTLWAYGGGTLRAYGFNGTLKRTITPPTVPGTPLVTPLINPTDSCIAQESAATSPTNFDSQDTQEDRTRHSLLAINTKDGSAWLAINKSLFRYSPQGLLLNTISLTGKAQALSFDQTRQLLWAATKTTLTAYGVQGTPVRAIALGANVYVEDISVQARSGDVWVALDDRLRRYSASGVLLLEKPLALLEKIATDGRTGVWASTRTTVRYLDQSGLEQVQLQPFEGGLFNFSSIVTLVTDPSNRSVWVANNQRLIKNISLFGAIQHNLTLQQDIRALALYADMLPPVISLASPTPGSVTNNNKSTIQVTYSDVGIGVDSTTLSMQVNGQSLATTCTYQATGATCTPKTPLPEGSVRLSVTVKDYVGNLSVASEVSFTIDTLPPAISIASPSADTHVTQSDLTISGSVSERATLTLNSAPVNVGGDLSFSQGVALSPGLNIFTLAATDDVGNTGSTTLQVTFDAVTSIPDPVIAAATPIDPTVATQVGQSTAFLYTGSNPIQQGVAPETIQPQRAAVIRGQVKTRDGAPLSGVTVSVFSHPEFGSTQTRADGMFDMAVNGGGLLTVQYVKDGLMPVQRQIDVPWQDYARVDDVVMIGLDPQVIAIDLVAQTEIEVAQGSAMTDADGTRQATLMFMPGTTATMQMPDGSMQPLSTINVRATEYTVGENGPAAMPGPLPATSGYTYAVEYSVDEAIAAGAKEVIFNQPVYTYVENFLDFPVGGIVPAGYYDRSKGVWIASKNGRVIKIVSITGGIAELDTDGDGTADDATQLATLDITDAERQKLAGTYAVGQSLWRVPVSHFTPWDYNWPYGPPEDAEPPKVSKPVADDTLDEPTCQGGSIIECENQTLRERLPITGAPFSLNYASDRTPGRKAAYILNIPVSGATVPGSLKRIELEIYIAGQEFKQTFPAAPNQKYTFTWDGKDAYGRVLQGSVNATIRIGNVYGAIYQQPAQFEQSFGASSGVGITGNGARQEITLWQEKSESVTTWDARALGAIGSWGLDVHHAYNASAKILYQGDGTRRSAQSVNNVITTVAGNGNRSFGGDGGPAVQAELFFPGGIAASPDGSLFIIDSDNRRVRRLSPDGSITTIAGNGNREHGGDGGSATEASFDYALNIALGPDGSLYIADLAGNYVRRVSPNGIISTFAGSGYGNWEESSAEMVG